MDHQTQSELERYRTGYEEANALCSQLMEVTESQQAQIEQLTAFQDTDSLISQAVNAEREKFNGERIGMQQVFASQLSEIQKLAKSERQRMMEEHQSVLKQKETEIEQLHGQLNRLFDHYTGPPAEGVVDQRVGEVGEVSGMDIGRFGVVLGGFTLDN